MVGDELSPRRSNPTGRQATDADARYGARNTGDVLPLCRPKKFSTAWNGFYFSEVGHYHMTLAARNLCKSSKHVTLRILLSTLLLMDAARQPPGAGLSVPALVQKSKDASTYRTRDIW
jgi:hypothetical protein